MPVGGRLMVPNITITIGRSFGSKGREIGEKLAEEMGFRFYDKNLILMASQESGINFEWFDSADEKLINRFLDPYSMPGSILGNTNDRVFQAQRDVILKVSSNENCVIVGRMADYVLKDNPNVIKVFIYAPLEVRVNTIRYKYNLTVAQSKKLIKHMDKIRKSHYHYFSDYKWDSKDTKDIMIDSSLLGVDGTVMLLKKLIELRIKEIG